MDPTTLVIILLSFGFSLLFALGGIGSALALVPVLHWYGLPLNMAKPIGLFVNTLSMTGASVSNIRHKRLDFRMGIPIIIASSILAPVGAWASTLIPTHIVLLVFIGFLLFSSLMMLFFKAGKYKDQYRDDRPVLAPAMIGAAAGFLSGLLGVGGGGLISPLMIMLGFNPKKVAAITAFAVPFSSIIGFVAYAMMGTVDWAILLPAALAAYAGGALGTHIMHNRMPPALVKKFLGIILLGLAGKLITLL
ncbi:MAG: sulfite exporter TauE/SafE family protein [Desulfobulbaceae bacterium]|nr:MAG: sulfite exporter TauE/SafE family protein [Desulfobulbaceae bacterium]